MADSPYFQLAKSIVRSQQIAVRIERLAFMVVAGQCICQEPERFAFTCPVHTTEDVPC